MAMEEWLAPWKCQPATASIRKIAITEPTMNQRSMLIFSDGGPMGADAGQSDSGPHP